LAKIENKNKANISCYFDAATQTTASEMLMTRHKKKPPDGGLFKHLLITVHEQHK
jgi:hypothetical protein